MKPDEVSRLAQAGTGGQVVFCPCGNPTTRQKKSRNFNLCPECKDKERRSNRRRYAAARMLEGKPLSENEIIELLQTKAKACKCGRLMAISYTESDRYREIGMCPVCWLDVDLELEKERGE